MYNVTNISNANTIVEYVVAVNQLSNRLFANLILLSLFIVIFTMFVNYDKKYVLLADSFITSIIGILFFIIGWINWGILIAPILIFFGTIIFIFIQKD